MNTSEQKAVLTIAMMAAFADGENSEVERTALRSMAESFGPDAQINLWDIYQDVVDRRRPLGDVAAQLVTPEARAMAYDLAAGVCEADGTVNEKERAFLDSLRGALNLGAAASPPPPPASAAPAAGAGAVPPLLEPVDTGAIDKMVINYSILNGALELLPHGLATMAIVPLQMRMVYRIGKRYGYALDRGHIRDFLATAGVGLASQAVESVARGVLGGLAGSLLGGLGRAVMSVGASGAFGFAGTYAIGQLANRYYAGGRKMETAVLRDTYARLLTEGRGLFSQHAGAVQARARTLNPADVINLVRNPP
ncbi:MAG: DUF533 domain-containing protein [Opitutaceae bacterium]|jgi:uncharacterized protein (DUF697 family)